MVAVAFAGFESGCNAQRISCAQRIASPSDFVRQHKSWPRRRCRSGAQNSSPRAVTGCRAAAVALPLRRGRATAAPRSRYRRAVVALPRRGQCQMSQSAAPQGTPDRVWAALAPAGPSKTGPGPVSSLSTAPATAPWPTVRPATAGGACSRRRHAPSIDLGLSSGTALVSKASARSGRGTGGRPVPRAGVHCTQATCPRPSAGPATVLAAAAPRGRSLPLEGAAAGALRRRPRREAESFCVDSHGLIPGLLKARESWPRLWL